MSVSIFCSLIKFTRTYFTRANSKVSKKVKTVEIRRQGEFLYGVSPCVAVMQASRRKIHKIYIKPGISDKKGAVKRSALDNIWKFAERRKIDVLRVDKKTLEVLSGKKPHQGIVMDVSYLNFKKMDSSDCKSATLRAENPVWLLLDEIHDPMNLGAILRCAYFLGADRVITMAKKCCPLSPTVSKASSGAMELMPVFSVDDIEGFLSEAKLNGWKIIGTCSSSCVTAVEHASDKQVPIVQCSQYIIKEPTIIALGNEGYGLRGCIQKTCSTMLTVSPHRQLPEGFDSLNVAVAAGILLHSIQQNKT